MDEEQAMAKSLSELDLPPPPPVPPGAVPTEILGYNNNNEGGNGGGGNGRASSSAGGNGSSALAALAGVPAMAKAVRPGFGRAGRTTTLCVNHFKAKLVKWDDVYHYNVTIDPPVTNKKVCRDIMKKLRETFGEAECGGKQGAYDGEKSLFTSGSLSFNTKEFPVFLDDKKGPSFRPGDRSGRPGGSPPTNSPPPGSPEAEAVAKRRRTVSRGRDFKVTIEFAAKIRMKAIEEMMRGVMGKCTEEQEKRALDGLRVLDIVLRESASERGYLLVRDNFFHPQLGPVVELGEGVHGWRGYHSSVRPTGLGMTLNLDITLTTVLKPVFVEEFLTDKFNVRDLYGLQDRDWHKAKAVLKGIRIETMHAQVSRTHKIAGFSDRPIRELKFTKRSKDGDGNLREEELSVEAYYFDVYSYNLKYPDLPALDVGNKKKPTFIPIELCKIMEGQRYTKSLSTKQRTNQIGACKQGPQERQKICEKAMEISNYNSDKLIKEFGLVFEPRLASIQGRILPPPQLVFGGGRTEEPREGRWNYSNKAVQTGATIGNWAVAVFDSRVHDGENIGSQLANCCNRQGISMKEPARVEKEPPNAQHMPPERRVEQMMMRLKSHRPMFILAVLPTDNSNAGLYVQFKRICETKIGVISQCMIKPRQLNPQYLGNLALKINLKLGGFNSPLATQVTEFLGPSTVIFGMDVSHGSTGEDTPSIAAVVATKNWPHVFHYATRARTQPAKMEMIEGLHTENKGSMVKELLLEYHKTCKGPVRIPTQIIVYRDGVSESQFAECLEKEVVAFKRACRDIQEDYNPGITFIVAQKRHNTRFFPQGNKDQLRNGNVIPGTVVDKDICHPHNYDFFLVSQAGLIGTSRPTHYHVLVNENKLSPDDIQRLTNNLCYTFGRCSTSISMAAPAAYAHVVAQRYRKLVDTWGGSDTSSSVRSGEGGRPAKPIPPLPALSPNLKPEHSMFFC